MSKKNRAILQPARPEQQFAKKFKTAITKQQATLFANAVQRRDAAQAEVNAIASAILAGRSVENATSVNLDWTNPRAPFITCLVLPDEKPTATPAPEPK